MFFKKLYWEITKTYTENLHLTELPKLKNTDFELYRMLEEGQTLESVKKKLDLALPVAPPITSLA